MLGGMTISVMTAVVAAAARMGDWGPVYVETVSGRFPVEPWATATNLVFLGVALYWARRIRGQWRRHVLLACSIPVLLVGWAAGTVYHATRSHPAWLLLDWLPIVILMAAAAIWLWRDLLGRPALAFAVFLVPPLLAGAAASAAGIPAGARITVSYAAIGLALVVPAVLHAAILNRRHAGWLLAALAAFAMALAARQADFAAGAAGWPMGSHFLWHLFGGAATFCVFGYLHAVRAGNGNADCAGC